MIYTSILHNPLSEHIYSLDLPCLTSALPGDTSASRNSSYCFFLCFLFVFCLFVLNHLYCNKCMLPW